MTGEKPHVFTIPAGESFVDALARVLLAEAVDPVVLSRSLILLPTRRGCRALKEAFLRLADGRPLLLPRLMPIGDIDEDELAEDDLELPPGVPSLKRQLLLTSLVLKLGGRRGGEAPSPDQAAILAAQLASLLDAVQIEGLSFDGLDRLVPEEYAKHWQITLEFLKIVTRHWPDILAEQGWMDAAERRALLLERRAAAWEVAPPAFPVIAAGSTGSMPATARLLSVVARLPRGRVVLPGLDRHLDEDSWESLPASHPQYGLARLLAKIGVSRDEVADWPETREHPRALLLSVAMRPAGADPRPEVVVPAARTAMLAGLSRIDCPTPREEAGAVALLMREALEHPGRRAALVTPDRDLGRRVAAELSRYDIEIDDSAGRPLSLCEPGAFLLLIAQMVGTAFAPRETLAALKHRLALGGLAPGLFRERVGRLELAALRGPRPGPGLAGARQVLAVSDAIAVEERKTLLAWLDGLTNLCADFAGLMDAPSVPLSHLLSAHCALAEGLAAGVGETGAARLWAGEAGEAAANFVADLAEAAESLPPLTGRDYPALLHALMASVTVRPAYGTHPRLAIWGPLEARLQHVDLLILGGLNEGCWPPEPAADPWLSRPMREAFGLPLPERRIGLSAHDFVQAAAAPEVVLTRSLRVEGTPTVPSRWLLRLDATLAALGEDKPWQQTPWVGWHGLLDHPEAFQKTAPPAPCPPVSARPRKLSATQVETWMRDPYAIYARHILGLAALEEIDADPTVADYGTVVHGALDSFIKAVGTGPWPEDAAARLLTLGEEFFHRVQIHPGLVAFWWPRFRSVVRWFVEVEQERRRNITETTTEVKGRLDFEAPAGRFTLTATADRVDILKSGGIALIDYKTGTVPTAKEMAAGFAPQLPIEAAIAAQGGFPGVPAAVVEELAFWRLKGGAEGGEVVPAKDDATALGEAALEGVKSLVAAFDDEKTPYLARPHPEAAPRYSDYGHLARIKEWASADEEGGE